MTDTRLLASTSIFEFGVCAAVLSTMFYRGVSRRFAALVGFVMFMALREATEVPLLFFRTYLNLSLDTAYAMYFYFSWTAQLVGLVLVVMMIYGLFSEAMRPFPGLHRIGKLVFRWVGAVSLAVATAMATGPQMFAKGVTTTAAVTELASRFQQGICVLILCLLIFVTFAIRPLGLTFRSHIFGVALGLGVVATAWLVEAAWYATTTAHDLYSPMYSVTNVGICLALGIWGMYFALPEPERRMILLPTTSPFFLWNRISEILGDDPGQVAVAGFTPDMLAPAEIEMLTAATSREAAAERDTDIDWSELHSSFSSMPELSARARTSLLASR